jgi:LDH2 family malate/lactate/ureidoglycolate dehydrogenase
LKSLLAGDSGLRRIWAAALDRFVPNVASRFWPSPTIRAERLAEQATLMLRAWGMPDAQAAIVVEKMLYADLRGIDSHGCAMLPAYAGWRRDFGLSMNPAVTVVQETATTALVDGGGGLGHVPATMAMDRAIEKALATGAGVVAVRNSGHFGAAGAYVAMAAARGCLGVVTTSTPTPAVVPTFGREARLGTNPIAIAAPGRNGRPFLLDIATSTVSLGTLVDRWRRRGRIPAGWAIDDRGEAVTSGSAALRYRRLMPLGGDRDHGSHKGYGLAAAVEILSSVLPGMPPRESSGKARAAVGHFMMAIDPARFRADDDFGRDLDALLESLRLTPPTDVRQPVLVPGDPEVDMLARRSKDGVPITRTLFEDLRRLSRAAGTSFILDREP